MKNLTKYQKQTIRRAMKIMEAYAPAEYGYQFAEPTLVKDYLKLNFTGCEREEFVVIFLDNQHQLISTETLFTGTIDCSAVYPREVVKAALQHNAAAVILAHNHPSGQAEPSNSDKVITRRLVEALKLVDIRVLDHVVIGGNTAISFAERGLI